MMALILLLIVAVAAFNIVAMLVMVVNDKRTDIAILRTLGASPRQRDAGLHDPGPGHRLVRRGRRPGPGRAAGAQRRAASCRCSSACCISSSSMPQVYYITTIPSELHRHDVAWISAAALLLTLLSTIYPALRAARTPPADALRYE